MPSRTSSWEFGWFGAVRGISGNPGPYAVIAWGKGRVLPCLIFEDEHLLVVNKPAGMNTHSPAPFAGEGLFEWLRNREPRWADSAIIHRLDKETSGILVFSKSSLANRSLTSQFAEHKARKTYLLLTDTVPAGYLQQ